MDAIGRARQAQAAVFSGVAAGVEHPVEAVRSPNGRLAKAVFVEGAGVAEFQRGLAALNDAQKRQGPHVDQVQRDSGCASLKVSTDFLNQAEANITPNVAINRETASSLLTYLPQLKAALPQMAHNLKCPS